jgi:hypothetical protein
MRLVVMAVALVLAFVAGMAFFPVLRAAHHDVAYGSAIRCVRAHTLCVGMKFDGPAAIRLEEEVGGFIDLYCGFDRPGGMVGQMMVLDAVVSGGCAQPRYVAQFSNGADLTSLWIDNGVIVQVDRYPRHTLDL